MRTPAPAGTCHTTVSQATGIIDKPALSTSSAVTLDIFRRRMNIRRHAGQTKLGPCGGRSVGWTMLVSGNAPSQFNEVSGRVISIRPFRLGEESGYAACSASTGAAVRARSAAITCEHPPESSLRPEMLALTQTVVDARTHADGRQADVRRDRHRWRERRLYEGLLTLTSAPRAHSVRTSVPGKRHGLKSTLQRHSPGWNGCIEAVVQRKSLRNHQVWR